MDLAEIPELESEAPNRKSTDAETNFRRMTPRPVSHSYRSPSVVLLTRTLEQGPGPGPGLGCQGPGQGQGLESEGQAPRQ